MSVKWVGTDFYANDATGFTVRAWESFDDWLWSKTHLGEQPLNKAEAHRLAHKLRDPKFYTARTKRAVNSRGAL